MIRPLSTDHLLSRFPALKPSSLAFCALLATGQVMLPSGAHADEGDTQTAAAEADSAEEEPTEEAAAIEVPDGDADELFAFAAETMQNRGGNMKSVRRAARGVVDTAAKIRTLDDVTVPQRLKAVSLQLNALQFLSGQDKELTAELDALRESIANSEHPAIRNLAVMEKLQSQVRDVASMEEEEQQGLVDRIHAMADEGSLNSQLYSLASQLAGRLGSDDQTEMAVSLLNGLAERMEESDDEQLQSLAERARGTARRLNLMGNSMTLTGTTGSGEEFDWSDYRGQVVLVDFWASWCGPCRGEIPNMKRNLAAYGDDFAIVGINMDNTPEAMQKYLDQEDISWVNIVGDEESGAGWNHPMARHYGVSGIPTAILVDREGKVISLSARGARLDQSLEELLGPPPEVEEPADTEAGDDEAAAEEAAPESE
ncbi:TlpA disulfide reductase family protein [Allorhodopirellula solitaria]|uniref:Thiol:disulfide interchange protein TlpA n=1 Tax=Allorhodopirellula solitaria TaxID=2527987 RepID=A0A5C5XW25_9BACT|nr:TlpA disulfide reductase family protein [Allorhodopirellula solitaria]TWT67527.1 Thiol:disulfide interchange protein TlpA [Allorhodopirellula solitaria]